MVQVSCRTCGETFLAKPSHIKNGFAKYCSVMCSHESARTGVWVLCSGCGKKVYRTPKYINQSKSKKYFCSKSCQTVWRNKVFSGERHANWKHGNASYRSIMTRAGREQQCELCHMTDTRVIEVHHKDRNRLNNDLVNLAWLCRNCHFLVHHHNAGRGAGLLV